MREFIDRRSRLGSRGSTPAVTLAVAILLVGFCRAPVAGAEVIACDDNQLPLGGVCRFCVPGQTCDETLCQDVLCDVSCGSECVYDTSPFLIIESHIRSNGPAIRFTGAANTLIFERGSGAAVEAPVGGSVTIDVGSIQIHRPVTARSGTIDVTVGSLIEGSGRGAFDASGELGGGVVRIHRTAFSAGLNTGFLQDTDLKAKGHGPGAPGGQVSVDGGAYLVFNRGHVTMDVSGASGGRISLPGLSSDRRLSLRARGLEGDGGTVTIDGTLTDDPAHQKVDITGCRSVGSFLVGSGADVRVDGRGRGGSFVAVGPRVAAVCARVKAAGTEAGGTVVVRNLDAAESTARRGSAWLLRADVRGRRGPGGLVQLEAFSSISFGNLLTGGTPDGGYTTLITGP